jgi:macrodomain Ter protein organizer (MatP/YcbG family)
LITVDWYVIFEIEQNITWRHIMAEDRKSLPVDLDNAEREKLRQIATKWGLSLSAAIKKLIKDAPL